MSEQLADVTVGTIAFLGLSWLLLLIEPPARPSRLTVRPWLAAVLCPLTLWSAIQLLYPPGPEKVLFSDDGPFGYMMSDHMRQAMADGPGAAIWNDLWWLGQSSGDIPMNVSYVLQSPKFLLLCLLALLIGILAGVIHNHLSSRPRETCPDCQQSRLQTEMYATIKGGRVCQTCIRSRIWTDRFKEFRK